MANVRIMTDAAAHLNSDVVDRHQIAVLPLEVHFGDETFLVNHGDTPTSLYRRMAKGAADPTHLTIPIQALEAAYARLSQESEEILVVLHSSQLSNAYQRALETSQAFMGRSRIVVMDSMSTSWGLGLIAQAAAKAAAEGQGLDEIVRLVRGMIPHLYLVFFVERLDYLEQGRRLGMAQALLGTMLRIKPLLLLEEGDIVSLEKVRTRPMALEKLVEFVAEFASIQQIIILRGPVDSDVATLIDKLTKLLSEELPNRQFPVVEYDPLLACHLGPEALGVFVYEGM